MAAVNKASVAATIGITSHAFVLRIYGPDVRTGDVWVVHASSRNGSTWRTTATPHCPTSDECKHVAHLPREDGDLSLKVHRWFSSAAPIDDVNAEAWDFGPPNSTMFTCSPPLSIANNCASPAACTRAAASQLQCFGAPELLIAASAATPASSWPISHTHEGRWLNLRSVPTWRPFGQDASHAKERSAQEMRCFNQSRSSSRPVMLLGDSVMRGTFYDLCGLLGGGCAVLISLQDGTAEWLTASGTVKIPNSGAPSATRVLFVEIFGCGHVKGAQCGVGLANMVSSPAKWEALLLNVSGGGDALVVLNSGAHDIATAAGLVARYATSEEAQLIAHYRRNMCGLMEVVRRVRSANPRIAFVFKATMHNAPVVAEHDTKGGLVQTFHKGKRDGRPACNVRGFPGATPHVIRALNAIARKHVLEAKLPFWAEPTPLSFSAPSMAFADPVHHSLCEHASAATHSAPKLVAKRCEGTRLHGVDPYGAEEDPYGGVLSWAQRGGLSLAITRTLGRYLCVRRDRGLSP